MQLAAPLKVREGLSRQLRGWITRDRVEKQAQAVDKRDGPWGQALISALVISSAGHDWVSRVIAQREGTGRSQCYGSQALQWTRTRGSPCHMLTCS